MPKQQLSLRAEKHGDDLWLIKGLTKPHTQLLLAAGAMWDDRTVQWQYRGLALPQSIHDLIANANRLDESPAAAPILVLDARSAQAAPEVLSQQANALAAELGYSLVGTIPLDGSEIAVTPAMEAIGITANAVRDILQAADKLRPASPEPVQSKKPTGKSPAASFRKWADTMQKEIDHKLRPFDQYPVTWKRKNEYESRVNEGRYLQRLQDKLYALAQGWNNHNLPPELHGLKTRATLEWMLQYEYLPTPSYNEKAFNELTIAMRLDTVAKYDAARSALFALGNPKAGEKTAADELMEARLAAACQSITDFFPTPTALIEKLLIEAGLKPGDLVLEPSAGDGRIVEAILEDQPTAIVHCCEWSALLHSILKRQAVLYADAGKPTFEVVADDFLEYNPGPIYDKIVANPPFSKAADIDHVRHMYDLLKPGGFCVSIMSESTFFRQDKKAAAFRDWLEIVGYALQNPREAFRDSGTSVATRTVIIQKPASDDELKQWEVNVRGAEAKAREALENGDPDALDKLVDAVEIGHQRPTDEKSVPELMQELAEIGDQVALSAQQNTRSFVTLGYISEEEGRDFLPHELTRAQRAALEMMYQCLIPSAGTKIERFRLSDTGVTDEELKTLAEWGFLKFEGIDPADGVSSTYRLTPEGCKVIGREVPEVLLKAVVRQPEPSKPHSFTYSDVVVPTRTKTRKKALKALQEANALGILQYPTSPHRWLVLWSNQTAIAMSEDEFELASDEQRAQLLLPQVGDKVIYNTQSYVHTGRVDEIKKDGKLVIEKGAVREPSSVIVLERLAPPAFEGAFPEGTYVHATVDIQVGGETLVWRSQHGTIRGSTLSGYDVKFAHRTEHLFCTPDMVTTEKIHDEYLPMEDTHWHFWLLHGRNPDVDKLAWHEKRASIKQRYAAGAQDLLITIADGGHFLVGTDAIAAFPHLQGGHDLEYFPETEHGALAIFSSRGDPASKLHAAGFRIVEYFAGTQLKPNQDNVNEQQGVADFLNRVRAAAVGPVYFQGQPLSTLDKNLAREASEVARKLQELGAWDGKRHLNLLQAPGNLLYRMSTNKPVPLYGMNVWGKDYEITDSPPAEIVAEAVP